MYPSILVTIFYVLIKMGSYLKFSSKLETISPKFQFRTKDFVYAFFRILTSSLIV